MLVIMDTLEGTIEKLQNSIKQKKELIEEEEMRQLEKREKAKLIQLPIWPEMVRAVPNSVLRGSLFAAIHGRYAKQCKREVLHNSEQLKIVYTGERLTQADLDVWEYSLHLARQQCLGHKIYFSERSFLKGLGRNTGKKDHEWLKNVFAKLGASWTEISHNGKTYCGGLLEEAYRDDDTDNYVLIINPKMARLYDAGHTYIQWEERQKIGNLKPLALWLHGYIGTHAKWYPHKVKTLKDLSGSETRQLKHFKQSLKTALDHLKKLKIINDFRIDEKNLVYLTRDITKSQQKYLEEKPL